MSYEVMVYFKGGGTAVYPVSACNTKVAKCLGKELADRWEPNLRIVKVTAKPIESREAKIVKFNPDKPFGEPSDDTEDLASHPSSVWFA